MSTVMELTDEERQVIARMRMTPEERHADAEARRLAHLNSLPPSERQAIADREAALAAMTDEQRMAYHAGQALAHCAWVLRRNVDRGMNLADAVSVAGWIGNPDVDWLIREMNKMG